MADYFQDAVAEAPKVENLVPLDIGPDFAAWRTDLDLRVLYHAAFTKYSASVAASFTDNEAGRKEMNVCFQRMIVHMNLSGLKPRPENYEIVVVKKEKKKLTVAQFLKACGLTIENEIPLSRAENLTVNLDKKALSVRRMAYIGASLASVAVHKKSVTNKFYEQFPYCPPEMCFPTATYSQFFDSAYFEHFCDFALWWDTQLGLLGKKQSLLASLSFKVGLKKMRLRTDLLWNQYVCEVIKENSRTYKPFTSYVKINEDVEIAGSDRLEISPFMRMCVSVLGTKLESIGEGTSAASESLLATLSKSSQYVSVKHMLIREYKTMDQKGQELMMGVFGDDIDDEEFRNKVTISDVRNKLEGFAEKKEDKKKKDKKKKSKKSDSSESEDENGD